MAGSVPHVPANTDGSHLILYDGVCGLCNRLVQFVLVHDRRRAFRFASLQSATGRAVVELSGGNSAELTSFYVVADYGTDRARTVVKGKATLLVASSLGWPWRAMAILSILPTGVLDRLYDVVARNRYRLFDRREQCLVPNPEDRSRFVDY